MASSRMISEGVKTAYNPEPPLKSLNCLVYLTVHTLGKQVEHLGKNVTKFMGRDCASVP